MRIKRTRFAFCEQQAKLAVSSAMYNRKLLLVCAIIAQTNLRLRRISMLSIAYAVDISRLTNYSLWECRWALMPSPHEQSTARGRHTFCYSNSRIIASFTIKCTRMLLHVSTRKLSTVTILLVTTRKFLWPPVTAGLWLVAWHMVTGGAIRASAAG